MRDLLDVDALLLRQLEEVNRWHRLPFQDPGKLDFSALVTTQHHANYQLWHQEDLARDPSASDIRIAQVKRTIDVLNQQRNDLIEEMDQWLVEALKETPLLQAADAEMNSETPGSIIDRLSISALKIYHMEEETRRPTATTGHHAACAVKLEVLHEQRQDLGSCLRNLIRDLRNGRKYLKVYRQMKMYNDSSMNPVLYSKRDESR